MLSSRPHSRASSGQPPFNHKSLPTAHVTRVARADSGPIGLHLAHTRHRLRGGDRVRHVQHVVGGPVCQAEGAAGALAGDLVHHALPVRQPDHHPAAVREHHQAVDPESFRPGGSGLHQFCRAFCHLCGAPGPHPAGPAQLVQSQGQVITKHRVHEAPHS
jgi:hypothetical protein